jgi:hypothetical protein
LRGYLVEGCDQSSVWVGIAVHSVLFN